MPDACRGSARQHGGNLSANGRSIDRGMAVSGRRADRGRWRTIEDVTGHIRTVSSTLSVAC